MANIERDKPVEHCGAVGAIDFEGKSVVRRTIVMMNALDHRGQDSAGMASFDGEFRSYKNLGLVSKVFSKNVLKRRKLDGFLAVGHNRYKIQGGNTLEYTQPILAAHNDRQVALAHNGNVPNLDVAAMNLFRFGVEANYRFDSDALAQSIVSAPGKDWVSRVQNGLEGIVGSYSLVIATSDGSLLAVRDPWGNRPLSYAETDNGMVVASETVAFSQFRTRNWHEVQPGEIIEISRNGEVRKSLLLQEADEARCIFEKIYLAYETSIIDGSTVSKFRAGLGKVLAEKYPNLGEVVTAVPESSRVAARSYAYHSGLPEEGLILKKPHQIKRAFMAGEMKFRKKENDAKFNFSSDAGARRIVVVDDSIIIGNTGEIMTANFRDQGKPERVSFLSTAPKVIKDCPSGVNMRSSDGEFIAYDSANERVRDEGEIAKKMGVDMIGYTTVGEMLGVAKELGADPEKYCVECFGGRGLGQLRYRVEQFLNLEEPVLVAS